MIRFGEIGQALRFGGNFAERNARGGSRRTFAKARQSPVRGEILLRSPVTRSCLKDFCVGSHQSSDELDRRHTQKREPNKIAVLERIIIRQAVKWVLHKVIGEDYCYCGAQNSCAAIIEKRNQNYR